MASENIKNLTVFGKAMSLVTAVALSATLIGCASNNTKEEKASVETTEQIQPSTENTTPETTEEVTEEKASSAVEEAITIMIEGTEKLSAASDEAIETESFKNAYEKSKQNFTDLKEFCFEGDEIAGYTLADVGASTEEFAFDALVSTGEFFGINVPSNREEAKEKLSEWGDKIWNLSTDAGAKVYSKYQDFKNAIIEKSEQK